MPRPIPHVVAAFILSSVVILTGASRAPAQTVPAGYRVETVVTGLSSPCTMAFLAHNDFFILEKNAGRVRRVQLGGPATVITTVAQLTVNGSGEQGLLGIALSPDFANDARAFIYFTNTATPRENRVVRYHWDGAALIDPVTLAVLSGSAGIHNGGVLAFDHAGMLLAVIGDQVKNGPTQNNPATSAVFAETGIVLRMNPLDGSGPPDNPFAAMPGWERVFAYGIRNCFGMTIDPITGDVWEAENGAASYDEVHRVPRAGNCGWSRIAGPDERDLQNVSDLYMAPGASYSDPAFSFFNVVVPTAIHFLHGPRWKKVVRDDCLVSMYGNGGLCLFDMNEDRDGFVLPTGLTDRVADSAAERALVTWATGLISMTDLEIGPDGYLYVVRMGSGLVQRIRPIHPMGDVNRDERVDGRDITLFVNVLLGASTDPQEIEQSDFDGDGAGDIDDLPMFIASQMLPN